MEEDITPEATDLALGFLAKQDLSYLSVEDLNERIEAMEQEIKRCRSQLEARGASKAAAESFFKS